MKNYNQNGIYKTMHEQLEELKNKLTKLSNVIFGNPDKSEEISLVSKVNLIFNDISAIKKWFGGSIIVIISCCLFIGGQLHTIADNQKNIEKNVERLQDIEKRVSTLEIIVNNIIKGEIDIQEVGSVRTIKIKK